MLNTAVTVYRGPHISYPELQTITDASGSFDLLGRTESGDWWQICCLNGENGWVAAAEVRTEGNTASLPILPEPAAQAIITADRLNVRSGPSVDYALLGTVEAGMSYEVIGRLNDQSWWLICCLADGSAGWVINDAVLIQGNTAFIPLASIPPLPSPTPTE